MIEIHVTGLTKLYRTGDRMVTALRAVDLQVNLGEFFVLLGQSGSGKTTLLRCVAGLEKPDAGEIRLGEQVVFSGARRTFVQPEDRGLGMVFQSYAIWPHLTVFENVALPLLEGRRRIPRHLVRQRVREALALVKMEELEERPAPLLSGGQQQRVALARALATNPKALLMDEPLSNLDQRLRESVRVEIRGLVKQLGITVLYVTHDQGEAMSLADRVAIMAQGQFLQLEHPLALYRKPADPSVAEFLGAMNWLEGRVEERGWIKTEVGTIRAEGAEEIGAMVTIGVRPADIRLSVAPSGEANEFSGEIVERTFVGDYSVYEIRTGSLKVLVKAMGLEDLKGKVFFRLQNVTVFPRAPISTGAEARARGTDRTGSA